MLSGNQRSFGDDLEKEISLLLSRQDDNGDDDFEKELNLYRSGSAPPTVEGSLNAVGVLYNHNVAGGSSGGLLGLSNGKKANGSLSEDELRSNPAYLSYYYSNPNLNPRLPPPFLSKEDWRSSQRLQGGSSGLGGIGDRRKLNRNDSVGVGREKPSFTNPPGFGSKKGEREGEGGSENVNMSAEWGGDGLIGLPGLGLGGKKKSFAEIFQGDIGHAASPGIPSRPSSRTMFENGEMLGPVESELAHLRNEFASEGNLRRNASFHSNGALASHSYASAVGAVGASLSRSTTPDPKVIARTPSPCLPPIGGERVNSFEKRSNNSPNSGAANLVNAFSYMNLSNGVMDEQSHLSTQSDKLFNKPEFGNTSSMLHRTNFNNQLNIPSHYQQVDNVSPSLLSYGLGGYSGHLGSPSIYENTDSQNFNRIRNHIGGNTHNTLPAPLMDPMYLQYLSDYGAVNDPNMGNGYMDLLQKAYVDSLLSPHKSPTGHSSHSNYYGNHSYGVGLSYPGSPLGGSPVVPHSPGGPVSPLRQGNGNLRYPSNMRNWNLQGGFGLEDNFASSLLEEFKSNKAKSFELAEIAGHVVEFSGDQYGSRFIQQKLETANIEEKNMVYEEINPQALTLMTDVFGNYVIQKFFEHGIESQRRELADKLLGNVLTLSLQMYGCRVIQKAIEVVDLDQKIKMVGELDGHIMRCVRDQNGNHVIQKCIECVPEKNIQFIVTTFFGHVVSLSTHPYGCRVIQRILEHCADPETQRIVMEEVLASVSMLAQDQYGNYVVQHVLEHGQPEERSTIIKELAGNIVQMSQQKFASNVVEKCLTFGGPAERLILVTEMLGTTDENVPLQAMMKDQFANYVVQKVLETCDDQQRELIMSRIKVHLNALKKYTYGKHIVARVEKLVTAGERRIAISAQSSQAV